MTEGRRGRLSGRTRTRDVVAEQPPWTQPRLPFEPLRSVSDDELEAIHKASLRVLAETGIDFLDETARRQLVDVGCQVDGDRVRFDPDLVMHLVSTAPAEFIMHAPSPTRNLHMGGNVLTYTSVASPPFVTGLGRDRRDGNRDDYRNLIKLGQAVSYTHLTLPTNREV